MPRGTLLAVLACAALVVGNDEPAGTTLVDLDGWLAAERYAEAEAAASALADRLSAAPGGPHAELAEVLDRLVAARLGLGRGLKASTREAAGRALAMKEARWGDDAEEVADTLLLVARIDQEGGEYDAARESLVRALDIRERVHGTEGVELAPVLDLLSANFRMQGQYDESLSRCRRALSQREREFGKEHVELAGSLTECGVTFSRLGEQDAAREHLQRALGLLEASGQSAGTAAVTALHHLALAYYEEGDFAAAGETLDRALALEEARGSNPALLAQLMSSSARILAAQGDDAAAIARHERALEVLVSVYGDENVDVAITANDLATALQQAGRYDEARSHFERAVAVSEAVLGPDHSMVGTMLSNLSTLLRVMGEYEQARPLLERSLAITETELGPEHAYSGFAHVNLAQLAQELGDYRTARQEFRTAREILEAALGPESAYVARALSNEAVLLKDMGEYDSARHAYERALRLLEAVHGPAHVNVAIVTSNLGALLEASGDYEEALAQHRRALDVFESLVGEDHPHVAGALNNMARVLQEQGELERARPLFERALSIRESQLGERHPRTAVSLDNLGALLGRIGQCREAKARHLAALEIRESSQADHPDLSVSLLNLAQLHRRLGEFERAEELDGRALDLLERTLGPDHPQVAAGLRAVALDSLLGGQRGRSLDHARRAEAIGRRHLALTARTLPERQALRYATVRTSALDLVLTAAVDAAEPETVALAWEEVLRSRALVLDEMGTRHRAISESNDEALVKLWRETGELRQQLANLYVRGRRGDVDSYRKLLERTRNEMEARERELARTSAAYRKLEVERGVDLARVVESLPPDSALVSYRRYDHLSVAEEHPSDACGEPAFTAAPRYVAFVVRPGEPPKIVDLAGAGDVERHTREWRRRIVGRTNESLVRRSGHVLRGTIWDPIVPLIDGVERAFLVPDGALHSVSFGALPTGDSSYLLESGPRVHYLSAERDLVTAGSSRSGRGLLALGGVDYDARETSLPSGLAGGPRSVPDPQLAMLRAPEVADGADCLERIGTLSALPSTLAEIDMAARSWRPHEDGEPAEPITRLRGPEASEEAFKRLASTHRVLHLATHGFFLRCSPDAESDPMHLSGLALAGANRAGSRGVNEEDGILTSHEVAALDLTGVEWAVLSACETGLGEVHSSEGILGLRRAFHTAGVGSLILSLWPVDDASTARWMEALYEARFVDRLGTAEAVHRASSTMLNQTRNDARTDAQPFHWAAFVAAGDWR